MTLRRTPRPAGDPGVANPSRPSSHGPATNASKEGVRRVCREGLAPSGIYSPAASAGAASAHDVMMRQLGWTVHRLSACEWAAVVGQPAAAASSGPLAHAQTNLDAVQRGRLSAWLEGCLTAQ
jgi:hypothetical protein